MESEIVAADLKERTTAELSRACAEYAPALDASALCEAQFSAVARTAERSLTRLDEFGSFSETVRAETTKTSQELLPAIVANAQRLRETFAVIDALAETVAAYTKTVATLEERAASAEKSFSNLDLKSFWRSIPIISRGEPEAMLQMEQWRPVAVPSIEPLLNAVHSRSSGPN
eukprot:m51a1_g10894 hypothetical protein (173) ;mRNA; r:18967-19568